MANWSRQYTTFATQLNRLRLLDGTYDESLHFDLQYFRYVRISFPGAPIAQLVEQLICNQ